MKKYRWIVCLLLILCLCGCSKKEAFEERTSIYALIIDPQAFDGERVTVRGALFIDGNEDVALYATTDDGKYMVQLNALWLGKIKDILTYTEEQLRGWDGCYVEVNGTINAKEQGPQNAYNCNLEKVRSIQKIEKKNEIPKHGPLPTKWIP